MATRGVFQLGQLTLHYCEVGGSSRAVREYLGNGKLVVWAQNHPHVQINVQPRNGHHPYVHAQYHTRNKSIHQVSVKNVDNWEQVESVMEMLSNRSGRKITKLTRPVLTDSPSVQGVWTPFLDLYQQPSFKVEFVQADESVEAVVPPSS
jgi:large subunit ribosomal protein L43